MPTTMPNELSESQVKIWKVTGALSGILGFSCYAVSSWLEYLIGPLDTGKIVGYCVVAFVSCVFTLVVDKVKDIWPIQFSEKWAYFVSLILTNVFSAWEEHRGKGKEESSLLGKTMNVISGAAFAIMAISFSKLLQLEFEVGMTNFMIGRFLIRSINVSRLFGMVAGLFCWVLIHLPDILAWVNNQLHGGGAVDAIPVSDFGNRGTASGSTQDTQPLGGGDQSRGGASTVGGDGPERDDSENFSEPVEGQFFNKGGFHKRVTAVVPIGESSQQDDSSDTYSDTEYHEKLA